MAYNARLLMWFSETAPVPAFRYSQWENKVRTTDVYAVYAKHFTHTKKKEKRVAPISDPRIFQVPSFQYGTSVRSSDVITLEKNDYGQLTHFQRGHVIADSFLGPDAPDNIVYMSKEDNLRLWKSIEEETKTLKGSALIGVHYRFAYCNDEEPWRATHFRVAFHLFTSGGVRKLMDGEETYKVGMGRTPIARQLLVEPETLRTKAGMGSGDNWGVHLKTVTQSAYSPTRENIKLVFEVLKTQVPLEELFTKVKKAIQKCHTRYRDTLTGHFTWKVEDAQAVPLGAKLPPLSERVYAVLDCIVATAPMDADCASVLQACHVRSPTLSALVQPGEDFKDWQKILLYATNVVMMGGRRYIVTNSDDDPVRVFNASEGLSFFGPRPSVYEALAGYALWPGSAQWEPQVDHIHPKSDSGVCAFSNAMILSGSANRRKLAGALPPLDVPKPSEDPDGYKKWFQGKTPKTQLRTKLTTKRKDREYETFVEFQRKEKKQRTNDEMDEDEDEFE